MIAEQPSASRPVCFHCGGEYRPFQWTHPRACPNCGRLLSETEAPRRGAPSRFRLAVAAGLLAVLLGSGAIVQLARERSAMNPRRGLHPSPAVGELRDDAFPADLAQRFDARLRYLMKDLRRAPDDPFLLYAVAVTHLQRALCFREENPDAARRATANVRKYATQLEGRAPHAALGLVRYSEDLSRLEWDRSGSILGLNAFWPFRTPFSELLSGTSLNLQSGIGFGEASYHWQIGPHLVPVTLFSSSRRMASLHAEERHLWDAPQGQVPPNALDNAPPEAQWVEWQPKLRGYLHEHPEDVRAADSFGTLLARAGVFGRFNRNASEQEQEQGRAYLREAAEVFRKAALEPQPKIYQAALYAASAECRRALGEPEQAYALWQKSVELAPYVPGFWQNLGKSAILIGLSDAGAESYRKRDYWQLPGIMGFRRERRLRGFPGSFSPP